MKKHRQFWTEFMVEAYFKCNNLLLLWNCIKWQKKKRRIFLFAPNEQACTLNLNLDLVLLIFFQYTFPFFGIITFVRIAVFNNNENGTAAVFSRKVIIRVTWIRAHKLLNILTKPRARYTSFNYINFRRIFFPAVSYRTFAQSKRKI